MQALCTDVLSWADKSSLGMQELLVLRALPRALQAQWVGME